MNMVTDEYGRFVEAPEEPRRCETCKYWDAYEDNRCLNQKSEYCEARMGPDETCDEWEEWGW